MDIVGKYISEIISFIAGLASGSLLTIKFTRKTQIGREGSKINQSGATAGGDVVGRDKLTGRDQS